MKILFLGMNLDGWHGSLFHIREYALFFKNRGDEVYVGSVFIAPQIRDFLEQDGIIVKDLDNVPLDITYDIVYALHLLLFPALLLKGLKYKKAILMSLSPYVPEEQLPPPSLWGQFDMLAVISEEIIEKYARNYGINKKALTVVPNHIPLNFINASSLKHAWAENIGKAAVISNHYVEEVDALKNAAPFEIDYYGLQYSNPVPVTPELLLRYDAVITIGKTVQYCLGLGIPVFEYDHFGGCGYITPENLDKEGKTNFSGRGTRRKLSPADLISELVKDYPEACVNAPVLRQAALQIYGIDKLIAKQIETLNARNSPRSKLNMEGRLFCNAAFVSLAHIYKALQLSGK